MELIDKAAVVAEIKRRIKERDFQMKSGCWVSSTYMYEDLLDFLDTLEVKEMDLENAYKIDRETAREKSILDETKVEYFATGKPTIAAYSEDNLRNQFDAGANWMKEQIIKALKE